MDCELYFHRFKIAIGKLDKVRKDEIDVQKLPEERPADLKCVYLLGHRFYFPKRTWISQD